MADEFEKWVILNAQVGELAHRVDEIEQTNDLSGQVIQVAIASLQPGPDDVVVFWLPSDARLAHIQVGQITNSFTKVIGNRFRFIVLVRHLVDIEIIKGKQRGCTITVADKDKVQSSHLFKGIRLLRLAVGEDKTNELINSDLEDRERVWGELMRSGHEPTLDALAYILTGLELDPDEMEKNEK